MSMDKLQFVVTNHNRSVVDCPDSNTTRVVRKTEMLYTKTLVLGMMIRGVGNGVARDQRSSGVHGTLH
jgi:hypothetical protein